MTITDRVGRPFEHSSVARLSVIGAIFYALWGCLHLQAAYAVYHVGFELPLTVFGCKPVVDAYYGGFAPEVSAFLSIAGAGWHIDNGVHCLRLILGRVFDRFPALQRTDGSRRGD
jgi:hypothetical protein